MTGATGFIGRALLQHLCERGHHVTIINRAILGEYQKLPLQRIIDGCDVVINLAGESIDQRWRQSVKMRIMESRASATRAIVSAMNKSPRPKLLISTSAVGIYPSSGCHNDYSRLRANTFLADVCHSWEGETSRLEERHALSICRFGVVFAKDGGAFPKLTPLVRFGAMFRVGSLSRHLSWIDRDDLCRAIEFIMESEDMRGSINICSPEFTTQEHLINASRASVTISIPTFLLRLLRGEAAEMVLHSCCTTPQRLTSAGFNFESPTIASFFEKVKAQ